MLLVIVGGCVDPVPEPEPQLIKQTNLKAEPLLGQMVSSLRKEAKSSRNPDEEEEDVFDQVNWNDISRYKDEEQSLYTATFLEDEGNFTDNMVVGGTADEPFAYVVRYKPEEGEFDGRLSTFTGTIEMYTLEGERFAREKLINGESRSHLRGEAAGRRRCIIISYQIIESCSKRPNDYCTVITYKRITICGSRKFEDSRKIYRRNLAKKHRRLKNRYGNYDRPPCIDLRSLLMNRNLLGFMHRTSRLCNHPVLIPKPRRTRRKPCPGDPIPNPEIAPQTYSKVKGARFGADARKQWNHDKTKLINKAHYGVDLKNTFGDPVYSMFDGKIIDTGVDPNGWGNWIMVKSNIDNEDVIILYAHLDKYNKTSGVIKVGQKLGIAGDSGNLKNAIKKGRAIQHIHIEARIGSTWSKATKTDPEKYIATKFGDDGKVTQKSKC